MKSKCFLLLVLFCNGLLSQNCDNIGFENGNFDAWKAFVGSTSGINYNIEGIVLNRHTILDSPEFDINTNNVLSTFPANNSGNFVVRLGNSEVGSQAEVLRTKLLVLESNKLFLYQYAVVLQDPGHEPIDQPKFEVRLYDADGNIVMPEECGIYTVVAGPETNEWGFYPDLEVRFKNWTTVGIDLSSYLNQEVTIEFFVQDCAHGAHFGYAYVNAYCSPMGFDVQSYCPFTNSITISGPLGFENYEWSISNENSASITSNSINSGDLVNLKLTSETGCISNVYQQFEYMGPINIGNDTIICQKKSFEIKSKINPKLNNYLWSTGENTSSIIVDETGDYFIQNSDSMCFDSDTIHVEFLPYVEIGEIPNIFTPNNDSKNDLFSFYSQNIENFSLLICNRWGNPIFETTNPNEFWDGTYKNKLVKEGVYFYILKYSKCDAPNITLHGNITVVY